MDHPSPSTIPAKRQRDVDDPDDSNLDMDHDDSLTPPPPKRAFARSGQTHGGAGPKKGKGGAKSGNGAMQPNSFAAKMMAKMGYKAGEGLGAQGQGRLNPIDTKLRPQGAGLGAVRERTAQAKAEEKRAAEARGETVQQSSEDEKPASWRKERNKALNERRKVKRNGDSGASTPAGPTKRKTTFKTAEDIAESAPGLQLPNVLKTLIDATGKELREISAAQVKFSQFVKQSEPVTEKDRISKEAQREVDRCVEEYRSLVEKAKYDTQRRAQLGLEQQDDEDFLARGKKIEAAIQDLIGFARVSDGHGDTVKAWDCVSRRLEQLEAEFENDLDTENLHETAVAAISTLFEADITSWSCLDEPDFLTQRLFKLRRVLGVKPIPDIQTLTLHGRVAHQSSSEYASPFESLLWKAWLPPVRRTITNDWILADPTPLIQLLKSWRPLIPDFLYYELLEVQILPRISLALQSWTPSPPPKQRDPLPSPQNFFFPWLDVLPSQYLDGTAQYDLTGNLKKALSTAFKKWDLTSPSILPGIETFQYLLPSDFLKLLTRHLLPRLSAHLDSHLTINPSDQDLTPLERVGLWFPYLPLQARTELLRAKLFPKWLSALHTWLSSSSYDDEEIITWFKFWKAHLEGELSDSLESEWAKGRKLIRQAAELGDRAVTELPLPRVEARKLEQYAKIDEDQSKRPAAAAAAAAAVQVPELTMRDFLEQWCEEESLQLIPTREAHVGTGMQILRITAAMNGKSGVLVYVKGDIIWAQDRRNKEIYKPMQMDDELLARAEGK
ncbi:MAG: hypothetical protein M1814_004276 [Vezdaea aestivalis]|nr:MAG: hypothetical protein M1814_004276 [Vezdaea aestivalis]